MWKAGLRSAVVAAVTVLGLSAVAGIGAASTGNVAPSPGAPGNTHPTAGSEMLPIGEMPAQKTTRSTCKTLENQGASGYGMQNRDGVNRVYEFAGFSSDPQGYNDMRVNVYVDGGNWIAPGGWSKGDLLGFTFIGCS